MTQVALNARFSTLDTSNPPSDKENSIGGTLSTTEITDNDGLSGTVIASPAPTITSFKTSEVTAGVEADWLGGWIILYSGTNANVAREIIGFDTGEFTVDPEWDALPVSGDFVRVFQRNNVFTEFTAANSAARETRHRLLFYLYQSGGVKQPIACFVTPHKPGPFVMEIVSSTFSGTIFSDIPFIPNLGVDTNVPDITTVTGGMINTSAAGGSPQEWQSPPLGTGLLCPLEGGVRSMSGTGHRAMWLRLRWKNDFPPRPQTCSWQIHVNETDDVTDEGSFMIVVDVPGPDLTAAGAVRAATESALRISGGSRVQAVMKDTLTGDPIPDYTVGFSLIAPAPGVLGANNQDVTTSDGIITEAVYISPTDITAIGTAITSVTDNGGIAVFNFTPGPTLALGDQVTVTGFSTNTTYNAIATITATGVGSFEDSSIAFTGDETGFFTFVELEIDIF